MSDWISEMPAWMSILPPLITIVLALVFREVYVSLLIGIMSGGIIAAYYEHSWSGIIDGILSPVDYMVQAVSPANGDSGHISVIIFSLFIGGMVAVITANGSMGKLVSLISKKATNKKRGQLATWFMGILIFFDDFANTMVVGNTMRPLTDRLKISREKLAYIVDSTAAPIAAIALITTWIGAELQFIQDGISGLENFPKDKSSYIIFLSSLKYMFYPVLTLLFILILILTGKDYGPMYKAENQVIQHGDEKEDMEYDKMAKVWKGIVPIALLILATLLGLWTTGYDAEIIGDSSMGLTKKLGLIIGAADSYKALLWASYIGLGSAILFSLPQLGMEKSVTAAVNGFKKMFGAIMILVLAWSLAGVTDTLHTADFITSALDGNVQAKLLPAITFVFAALIAFSTGSSWGTMAILYPIVIGTSWSLGLADGLTQDANYQILINVIACVLAGSVLGDHCSPISDTTILSSLASDCDHISHVKTQLPYALTVGFVALIFGTIASAYGVPSWICFVLGLLSLFSIVSYFGKSTQ
ncbi:MAG: Na+/H+ antiporter NhaC family protein [Bacteroidia bacterium]